MGTPEQFLFSKSDYEVLIFDRCKKPLKNSKAFDLLEIINSKKVCLSSDIVRASDLKGRQSLDLLQKNRQIIRMTLLQFNTLVPFPDRYKEVIERSNGKRIIVSSFVWSEKLNIYFSTFESEKINKFNEVLEAVINDNTYMYYNDINGFPIKKEKIRLV